MSGQRWPNAILEREWLALHWHMQGLFGYGRCSKIEPTVGNSVGPMSKMKKEMSLLIRSHKPKSSLYNKHVAIATSRGFPAKLGYFRAPPESPEKLRFEYMVHS